MITMDPIAFIILLIGVPISIYAYHFELKLLWNSVQIAKNGKMLMGQLTPEQAKQMLSMAEGYYTKKDKKGKKKNDKDDISYGSMYQCGFIMLEEVPEIMKNDFDKDSLIYNTDKHFYYGNEVSQSIINDINNHTLQIFSGYYEFNKGWNSPIIYLIGRGIESGKFKIKVQNFMPYCYIQDDNGDYKTYLGEKVEKLVLKGMHPENIATYRKRKLKGGYPSPYESDILFVRRFLIDTYDYFKPTNPITPKIAILDIETDYPVTENIISFAINDMEGPLQFESKYDTKHPTELALDIFHNIVNYDIVTGWNVNFDLGKLYNIDRKDKTPQILTLIDHHLDYARSGYKYNKETYIQNMIKGNRYYDENETRNLIELLINYEYLKLDNGIIVLGKEFDPNILHHISMMDTLSLSKKMYGREIKGKWSLDNIGAQLAGLGKVHLGAKQIRDLTEDELIEYNCIDSVIPEIIENMLGGLEAHLILSWSLQSTLEDVAITAVVNDIALLRAYHKNGLVLPTRDYSEVKDDDNEPKYKAAEPDAKVGVYDGLIVGDLVHAYPFAVISKNISPETKDPNGENIVKFKNLKDEEVEIRFNNNRSVFIDTLKELMDERKKVKKQMKLIDIMSDEYKRLKSIDFALKTQTAAFSHGIFGWAKSRMRDYEVADAITGIVRNIINLLKEACDTVEKQWVYLHTDSIFINADKPEKEGLLGYLNDILGDYCEGYKVLPELEYKGFFPKGYIHSPARNVLVPEGIEVDNHEEWKVTGMNYERSEVPEELANIEIELIKMKMKKIDLNDIKIRLKDMVKDIPNKGSSKLGIIKPLTKPITNYGKELLDGTHGGYPGHINALLRANEEYGFEVEVGDKFFVIPILTSETEGKKKIKRKRVTIAFSIEEGLPPQYKIDYEYYLRSNLFGKINELFEMKPKDLEKEIIDEEMKKIFGINEIDIKEEKNV